MTIIDDIKGAAQAGTIIPKPNAKADFVVKGWGKRGGEDALVYLIPNHKDPGKPHQKGIAVSEWKKAYGQIMNTGSFNRGWFAENMPRCASEGGCNFTTIGGVLEMLGIADYRRGVYVKREGCE